MSTTFPPYVERQLKLLATKTTLYRTIDLGINKFVHPDGTGGRAHEVFMVFRRPGGDVLTFRKTFYPPGVYRLDRKSTRLNSSHRTISYAVFCLKKQAN